MKGMDAAKSGCNLNVFAPRVKDPMYGGGGSTLHGYATVGDDKSRKV